MTKSGTPASSRSPAPDLASSRIWRRRIRAERRCQRDLFKAASSIAFALRRDFPWQRVPGLHRGATLGHGDGESESLDPCVSARLGRFTTPTYDAATSRPRFGSGHHDAPRLRDGVGPRFIPLRELPVQSHVCQIASIPSEPGATGSTLFRNPSPRDGRPGNSWSGPRPA